MSTFSTKGDRKFAGTKPPSKKVSFEEEKEENEDTQSDDQKNITEDIGPHCGFCERPKN